MATSLPAYAADLKVGANIGNVPWEFQNEKGEIVGFEIDLAKEVGKRLGMKVEIVNIPFQGLFAAVQSGQIDAAVSSITITKKRLEIGLLRPALLRQRPVADRARRIRPSRILATMSGKVVGVDTGSTGDMWATQNQAKYKFSDIRRFEGLIAGHARSRGRSHRRLYQRHPGGALLRQGQAELQGCRADQDGRAILDDVRQERPLLEKVNAEITKMKQDGTLAKIHEKWFGTEGGCRIPRPSRSWRCRSSDDESQPSSPGANRPGALPPPRRSRA